MIVRRIPDWVIQLTWFAAALGATGAFWYFLAQHNRIGTLWSAVATVVLISAAVGMHMFNDGSSSASRTPGGDGAAGGTHALPANVSASATNPVVASAPAAKRGLVTADESTSADLDEINPLTLDVSYTPITMVEFFRRWEVEAKTTLQQDELQAQLLNKRVIWEAFVRSIEPGRDGYVNVVVKPGEMPFWYSTAILNFEPSQRAELLRLRPGSHIRFTGIVSNFIRSPFIKDCRLLRVVPEHKS